MRDTGERTTRPRAHRLLLRAGRRPRHRAGRRHQPDGRRRRSRRRLRATPCGGRSGRSPDPPARPTSPTRCAAAPASAGRRRHLAVVSAADPGRPRHRPTGPPARRAVPGRRARPRRRPRAPRRRPRRADNDVNWAARAERAHAGPGALADFAYLHLGEGLGCALVSDGEVRRGHRGLSGEIAHLVTTGPDGRAMPFTRGLRRARPAPAGHHRHRRRAAPARARRPGRRPGTARPRHRGRLRGAHRPRRSRGRRPRRQLGHPPRTGTGDPHPPRPAAPLGGATACRRSRPARPRGRPATRDPPAAGSIITRSHAGSAG